MFGQLIKLAQVTYSSGVADTLDVRKVNPRNPDGSWNYIAGLFGLVRMTLTSAATSDAITQDQFARILTQFQVLDPNGKPWLDNDFNGCALRELQRALLMCGYFDPTAIAADSNTARTVNIPFYLPYSLPKLLKDQDACLRLAAELASIRFAMAASTIYGTGQTISACTLNLYADVVQRPKLRLKGRLKYSYKSPTTFSQEKLSIFGRLLYLGVHDVAGAATPTIGTTDFTAYEIIGRKLNIASQPNDLPTWVANIARLCVGDAHDAALVVPNVAAVKGMALYYAPQRVDVGKLGEETEIQLTLTTGAGAPAVTDQVVMIARITGREEGVQAAAIGAVPSAGLTAQQVIQARVPGVEGKAGSIPKDNAVGRYLPRPVAVK